MSNKRHRKRDTKRKVKENESKIDFDKLIKPVQSTDDGQAGTDIKVEYVSEIDEKIFSGNHQLEFGHIFDKFKTEVTGVNQEEADNSGQQNGAKKDKNEDEESKNKISKNTKADE